ncbi:hypothetical protein LTR70_001747 [Exophiala xenobiotica]|uniref:Uncharacterized protein n=1 Tax=Lithohypha guttulata TaxID=1690604 RepID=A0ABR0KM26_9EURO|nr:hypothetical protein LTR24_001060 [Lithohypha guttulata]KAK5327005.1 hypothetical protein LTR70_001747 [Exophiala xenobiotica]
MYEPKQSRFVEISQIDPQSIEHSKDDIPLRPTKAQPHDSIAYVGATNTYLGPNNTAETASYHPTSRPRPVPAHHFWRSPCGLGTVVFIAVVGRLMRTYALWRAERGASLGLLEQLNGSQNLLAAFERAILLPGLGILSIGVVFLWALSPVGGQSALRVLGQGQSSTLNMTTIYYFNNTGDANSGAFAGAANLAYYGVPLNAAFQATLSSLQRVKDSDIWGNVKIPVLHYMPTYTAARQDKDGWYDFNANDYDSPYSALNGIVVSGLKDGLDTNFTMESNYFNLTCTDPAFFNYTDNEDTWGGFANWTGKLALRGDNTSLLFNGLTISYGNSGWNSYMVDSNYVYTSQSDPNPKYNIIYASIGSSEGWVAAFNCTVGVYHVESDILCSGSDCHVRRVRPSLNTTWSNSGWPFPSESITLPHNMLTWLGTATGSDQSAVISPIDFYMAGYDTPFMTTVSGGETVSYNNVTGKQFAKRLQSLVNTGWQLSFQNQFTAQTPPDNKTALALSTNTSTTSPSAGGVGYTTTATTGTTISREDIFIANKSWITVTVVVAFVLLFCGIASMIFKYGTRSPDILGFVSSMTRDNPDFEDFPGGDKLDGLQRARVLRHVRVQIADVRPWDEDGHVTLRNLGPKKSR